MDIMCHIQSGDSRRLLNRLCVDLLSWNVNRVCIIASCSDNQENPHSSGAILYFILIHIILNILGNYFIHYLL